MRCPYCGIDCVWDPDNGVWVCPECGESLESKNPKLRAKTNWF